MRARLSFLAFAASCLGLGASLASLVDYLATDAAFCDTSGCSTVRLSAWARPLGIPMPVFGVVFFAVMVGLSLVPRPRLRLVAGLGGALWAIALIGVQAFALHAWCKLCLVSDLAAIAVGAALAFGATTLAVRARVIAVGSLALAAVPALFFALAPAASVADTPPLATTTVNAEGKVTIVEYVDFECPFCRRFAPVLEQAIANASVPVTVVRKMFPLQMHPHARTAALAWCCADAQGKGDEMAAALFATEPDDLTPENCEQIATTVGCDLERYRESFVDPATAQRVDTDLAEAKAAGVHALPTISIGDEQFTGANHDVTELVAAIERQKR